MGLNPVLAPVEVVILKLTVAGPHLRELLRRRLQLDQDQVGEEEVNLVVEEEFLDSQDSKQDKTLWRREISFKGKESIPSLLQD